MEINAVQVIKVTYFSMTGASQGFAAVVPLCLSRERSQRCQHVLKWHELGTVTSRQWRSDSLEVCEQHLSPQVITISFPR